jgi:hypothetical protein
LHWAIPPLIRAYRPETVIAEKLEATVSLGIRNGRIKDFFDIDYLARTERFDRHCSYRASRWRTNSEKHEYDSRPLPVPRFLAWFRPERAWSGAGLALLDKLL